MIGASPSAIVSAAAVTTATLDTVVFGSTASETAHSLVANSTSVIAGGVGQPARQLLPLSTVGVNGGDLTFTMTVDAVNRNYFSIKLFGSDDTDLRKGRLYLYIPVGGTNYQVGYRHEGDYIALNAAAGKPALPGRFMYSTTPLPLAMTQGKTSLTLRIQSTGELYSLGGGGGPPDGGYQLTMDRPSRGVYAAYTHTQPMLDVSGETQGTVTTTTAPVLSADSVLGLNGSYTNGLKGWVTGKLAANVTTGFSASEVQLLARSWSVSQVSNAYHNVAVVNKVIAVIDAFAGDYFSNPTTAPGSGTFNKDSGTEVWGGRFGLLGWAVNLLAADATMQAAWNQTANFGPVGGNQIRRNAWATMLKASFDFGRFNRDGRYLTNQSIYANLNIYRANRGLLALGSSLAVAETAAQRYLKETFGMLPWLGSDLPNGGSSLKYGSNYFMVTPDGLTREWGYAGTYGEMALRVAEMYRMTGNAEFRDQAVKMAKAMAYFRRPAVQVVGANNYRAMERVGVLAWRGARESDSYIADEIAYAGGTNWSAGMITAAATGDPTLIGYARQMLNDNQYLSGLISDGRYYKTPDFDALNAFEPFDDYNAVVNAPDSGARLPMTPGGPDAAFSDEQDGILAVKRGDTIIYLEPFWQARIGTGTNGVGRFSYITPRYEQYGTFETADVQYTSDGAYYVRPNMIDSPAGTGYVPPDNPQQAYAGEKLPIPTPPANAVDQQPFRGKVDFYGMRFGNLLVGMNTTAASSYTLQTPPGFTSATDVFTGQTKSGVVTVGPNSTIALQLASAFDPAPVPTQPLLLTAVGAPAQVVLNWTAAGGATGYTVNRSTAGGAFAPVATNLTGTTFTDTAVARGVNYTYTVTATNTAGQSAPSSRANTSAGLPVGWSNADIGTVAIPGSASKNGSAFTVRGTGDNIGGNADSFHFAYATLNGNGTIITRVANAMNTNGGDKLGIMLRESTAAGAKHLDVTFMPALTKVDFTVRSSTDGTTSAVRTTQNITKPYWLKLTRSGNVFTAELSPDGVTWTNAGTTTVTMNASLLAGLFVCSRHAPQLNASVFDNVSLTGVDTAAPTLTGVASRKSHGTAGTFDKPLSLDPATPSIESRAGGAATLLFNFSEPIFAIDGTINASEFTIGNASFTSATLAGSVLTLNLGAVTDADRLTVALNGLRDAAGNVLTGTNSLTVGNLFCDVNGSGAVDAVDIALVKSASGRTVDAASFLLDLNASGSIDAVDIALVKSASGRTINAASFLLGLNASGLIDAVGAAGLKRRWGIVVN